MAASETASGPKPAFVYMVRCAGGQLYTGWTNDPAARLRAHQSGKGAKYTRAQGALGFAYLERCADRSAARLPRKQSGKPAASVEAGAAFVCIILKKYGRIYRLELNKIWI